MELPIDSDGWRLRHVAAARCRAGEAMLDCLRKEGLDIDAHTKDGRAPPEADHFAEAASIRRIASVAAARTEGLM